MSPLLMVHRGALRLRFTSFAMEAKGDAVILRDADGAALYQPMAGTTVPRATFRHAAPRRAFADLR